jgi:hypothetical protein
MSEFIYTCVGSRLAEVLKGQGRTPEAFAAEVGMPIEKLTDILEGQASPVRQAFDSWYQQHLDHWSWNYVAAQLPFWPIEEVPEGEIAAYSALGPEGFAPTEIMAADEHGEFVRVRESKTLPKARS